MSKNSLSMWQDSPFFHFRKEMDNLMESFFGRDGLPEKEGFSFNTPSIDIKESEKVLTLTAELPGMDQEDIDLEVRNGLLTLSGEKKQESEDEQENYHVMERRYGSFKRSIPIPERVDESAISATFEKGVLKVSMPVKPGEVSGTRKIAIGKA